MVRNAQGKDLGVGSRVLVTESSEPPPPGAKDAASPGPCLQLGSLPRTSSMICRGWCKMKRPGPLFKT